MNSFSSNVRGPRGPNKDNFSCRCFPKCTAPTRTISGGSLGSVVRGRRAEEARISRPLTFAGRATLEGIRGQDTCQLAPRPAAWLALLNSMYLSPGVCPVFVLGVRSAHHPSVSRLHERSSEQCTGYDALGDSRRRCAILITVSATLSHSDPFVAPPRVADMDMLATAVLADQCDASHQ